MILGRPAAKLTVYENKETFKQLCDNIVMQWVEEVPPGSRLRAGQSMELIHASATAVDTRMTPSGPQDALVPHGAINAEHSQFVVQDRRSGTKMKFRMSSSQNLIDWVRELNDVAVRGTAGYEEVEARVTGGRKVQREKREKREKRHHHHHHNHSHHKSHHGEGGGQEQPGRRSSRRDDRSGGRSSSRADRMPPSSPRASR